MDEAYSHLYQLLNSKPNEFGKVKEMRILEAKATDSFLAFFSYYDTSKHEEAAEYFNKSQVFMGDRLLYFKFTKGGFQRNLNCALRSDSATAASATAASATTASATTASATTASATAASATAADENQGLIIKTKDARNFVIAELKKQRKYFCQRCETSKNKPISSSTYRNASTNAKRETA